jgi:hypothetical protein
MLLRNMLLACKKVQFLCLTNYYAKKVYGEWMLVAMLTLAINGGECSASHLNCYPQGLKQPVPIGNVAGWAPKPQ